MKTSEEKGGSGQSSGSNPKIRIAVIGQHDVGKSALTVRYLTRRYIGEYKSNADLLYRQTLTVTHGSSLDIEIVDISTKEINGFSKNEPTFPMEEMQRADAFIVVYSITDRNSFTFAIQTLSSIASYQQQQMPNLSHPNQPASQSAQNGQQQPHSPPPTKSSSIVLLANKNDLEHMRTVEKVEGLSLAMQYGCHFNEISVAENSPELYQSFHTIISNFSNQNQTTSKRKFSVSKMLGNLRIGRTSPCQQVLSQASIVDTSMTTDSSTERSPSSNPAETKGSSCNNTCTTTKVCCQTKNSADSNHLHNHISSSICHIKSKIVEFHSIKKRHNSPPICSL
ncbi:unnamed protein product [Allacma fusca]|uniref:Uncharacterized protein n=1 Tax=Allacma fusca TaxID=39272 RepID=A0A8J2LHZ7_9HEXA|nr:unnamed protein product [Allacma fusca]